MFVPDILVIVKWMTISLKYAWVQEVLQLGDVTRGFGRHADW